MTTPRAERTADLEEWVKANAGTFRAIALASGTEPDLVHLAAVFVKSGLTDEQILAECEALVPRFGAFEPVEAGLRRALPLLRQAVEGIPTPAGDAR